MNWEGLMKSLLTRGQLNQGKEVTLFLMNGYQMRGKIKYVTDGWIIFEEGGKEKTIFLHAISTID